MQFARRRIPPFFLSAFLFLIDWLIWSAGPCETPRHRPDSFICSPEPGDSRVPAARAPAFVCPGARVQRVLHVCVICRRVSSGCRGWRADDGGGGGGRGGGSHSRLH